VLTDLVCHCGDVRRPSGLTRNVPEATLVTVADTVKGVGFPLRATKRIVGRRLSVTDSDWSTGDGPSLTGPLASLIFAMAGRRAPLEGVVRRRKGHPPRPVSYTHLDVYKRQARDAAKQSMVLTEAGDRDGWLALFADDAVVEDPVGPSAFDPEAKGHRGKEAITAFYDLSLIHI